MFMSLFSAVRGGVSVPHRKHTADQETVRLPLPATVTLSMSQHIGPSCEPTVKVGDTVKVGQIVGDSTAFLTAPVHASVSGEVVELKTLKMPGGQCTKAIVIRADGKQTPFEGLAPPTIETHEQFIAAVRACGLVGLGGAGFPAHVKLNPHNIDTVDTLIVNAAECEPYITSDYRECMEHPLDIIDGVEVIMTHLKLKTAVIAVEDNKPLAIKRLAAKAKRLCVNGREVTVKSLPARYPQGAEKVLIAKTIGRKVPPGSLPADVGCVVMNVTSVAVLARFLKTGMPLVEKRVTVDGACVGKPQNVLVPLGTSIHDVLAFCDVNDTPAKLLMGGPMMGTALRDDTLPVLKQNNALLALSDNEVALPKPTACIRCGKCVGVCPMSLTPPALAAAFAKKDVDELKKRGVLVCMECGSCAYTCPAHRPIVQMMRLAKDMVRNAPKSSK